MNEAISTTSLSGINFFLILSRVLLLFSLFKSSLTSLIISLVFTGVFVLANCSIMASIKLLITSRFCGLVMF